jgi:hypothetical protein
MARKPGHRETAPETAANNLQLQTRKPEIMKARNPRQGYRSCTTRLMTRVDALKLNNSPTFNPVALRYDLS